jgi:hypothetical protein
VGDGVSDLACREKERRREATVVAFREAREKEGGEDDGRER